MVPIRVRGKTLIYKEIRRFVFIYLKKKHYDPLNVMKISAFRNLVMMSPCYGALEIVDTITVIIIMPNI